MKRKYSAFLMFLPLAGLLCLAGASVLQTHAQNSTPQASINISAAFTQASTAKIIFSRTTFSPELSDMLQKILFGGIQGQQIDIHCIPQTLKRDKNTTGITLESTARQQPTSCWQAQQNPFMFILSATLEKNYLVISPEKRENSSDETPFTPNANPALPPLRFVYI